VLDWSRAWLALEARALGVSHQTPTPWSCKSEDAFGPLIAAIGAYTIHSPCYSPTYMRKRYGAAGGATG
jgi:hypothetical protein